MYNTQTSQKHTCFATQVGLVPTYWSAISSLLSNDHTPEQTRVQETTV